MISPQGQHQKLGNDFARPAAGHGPGPVRPVGAATLWWTAVTIAALALACVGAAGVIQSAGMQCRDVSHRACIALVIDDLTGRTERPAPAD
jgi:hypothetical protein